VIDVRVLREDPDRIRAAQKHRGESAEVVDELLGLDAARRQSIATYEKARAEQKVLGKQISQAAGDEKQALLMRTKELSSQVKAAEAAQSDAEAAFRDLSRTLPNLASPEAPVGGEDDFVVLEEIGTPRDFAAEGFEPRTTSSWAEASAPSTSSAAPRSAVRGSTSSPAWVRSWSSRWSRPRWPRPRSGASCRCCRRRWSSRRRWTAPASSARLPTTSTTCPRTTSTSWARRRSRWPHTTAGRSSTPGRCHDAMPRSARATGARQAPTARTPADLPGALVRQGGDVHVHDGRGVLRRARRLLAYEKEWMSALGLPFRVVDVAAGDLGSSAVRKFDCEAWIPTQGKYRELTSTSNCTSYQARRLDTRIRTEGGTEVVATLNGTLMAATRTIVALLENHQQADGSVRVPEILQPHLGGRTVLEPLA
jgi:seryl-tRNA synthetase